MQKIYYPILTLVLSSLSLVFSQEKYKVQRGDTLYSLSKKYNVTITDLYKHNPEVKSVGLRDGASIIIPSTSTASTTVSSATYTVKSGDTLYSISKQEKLDVHTLKSLNPDLTDNLTIGQTIVLEESAKKPVVNSTELQAYTVQKGDTFYSLGKRFNASEETIKAFNPVLLQSGLKEGQVVYFPKNIQDGFVIHNVVPGETIFSITRKYNVTLETLLKHNPTLKQGLKSGMKLKIPIVKDAPINKEVKDKYNSKGFVNVVYLLPFSAKNNTSSSNNKRSMMTADFYLGSLFALDSLVKEGHKINVKTLDTNGSLKDTQEAFKQVNFDTIDWIVGPLRSDNVHWIADQLKGNKRTKIITGLSKSIVVTDRKNLISTAVSEDDALNQLAQEIADGKQLDHVYIIGNDNVNLKNSLSQNKAFEKTTIEQISSIKNFQFDSIAWHSSFVLNTTNTSIASVAIETLYNNNVHEKFTKVYAFDYNAAYIKGRNYNPKFKGNDKLQALQLTVVIPNYYDDNKDNVYRTVKAYENVNKVSFEKSSATGFDITYYFLREDLLSKHRQPEEGIYNTFELYQEEKTDGYKNKGVFVIKY